MSKRDVVWEWVSTDVLERILIALEWGAAEDELLSRRWRESIVRWMQLDAERRPDEVRIGFFPRDYVLFWDHISRWHSDWAASCEQLSKATHRLHELTGTGDQLSKKCMKVARITEVPPLRFFVMPLLKRRLRELEEHLAICKEIKAEADRLSGPLEPICSRPFGERALEAIAEHERLVYEHRKRKKDHDDRWLATIAAELAENPDVSGAEISRRHQIPVSDVYRLWKSLRTKQKEAGAKGDRLPLP